MARRLWMVGVAGVGVVVLASAPGSSDQGAATAGSAKPTLPPPPTERPSTTAETSTTSTTTTSTTVVVPTTTSSTTTTSTATTSTTSTSTSTPTTSTSGTIAHSPSRPAKFNHDAFNAVIAAGTVDVGDLSSGVAVMLDGKVLHAAAFGTEDRLQSVPATVDTRFRIASISKMFTAVAIMQLADEGFIDLDRPFVDQLGVDGPFADPRVGAVTVRQLLSHMSGFPVSRGMFFGRGVEDWHQAATTALGEVLESDPGTAFRYSNTNFCLLGLLIEHVTLRSFEEAITVRVLDPIGIHAHLAPTFDTRPGDAFHASGPGRNYMEALGPAGGWVASPTEIARLAQALRPETRDPRLLDEDTVAKMRVRVTVPVDDPPPVNGWSYGLGLMLFGDGSWGHTGTIESTHAIVINRNDGLTVALMVSGMYPSNSDELVPLIDAAVAAATAG